MKQRGNFWLVFASSFMGICLNVFPQNSNPSYSVAILGVGEARGVNNAGQVVGVKGSDAVVWSQGTLLDLGPGIAYSINASGQVVGGGSGSASLWTGTTRTDLGALVPAGAQYAYGLNDSGQAVSNAISPSGVSAVLWSGGSASYLPSNSFGLANAINNNGEIVGAVQINNNGDGHAILWTIASSLDLGTLGGVNSEAYDINDYGLVVGDAQRIDGVTHATTWTPSSNGYVLSDLGSLGGKSYAVSVNNAGVVDGISYLSPDSNSAKVPFVYLDGTMYNLEQLLAPGSGITDLTLDPLGNNLNDLGQIAATATEITSGQRVAVLLTPSAVPEPSSLALMTVVLGVFGVRRARGRPLAANKFR